MLAPAKTGVPFSLSGNVVIIGIGNSILLSIHGRPDPLTPPQKNAASVGITNRRARGRRTWQDLRGEFSDRLPKGLLDLIEFPIIFEEVTRPLNDWVGALAVFRRGHRLVAITTQFVDDRSPAIRQRP